MGLVSALLALLCVPPSALWRALLNVPRRWALAAAVLAGCIALYLVRRDAVDLYVAAGFAALGYALHLLQCDPAPLLLGCLLGPRIEAHARDAVSLAGGDWSALLTRPWSAALLGVALASVLAVWTLPGVAQLRRAHADDD